MIIAIANDHGGFETKNNLKKYLESKQIKVIDFGSKSKERTDFPDYAFKIGECIQKKEADFGITICKTGSGFSVACNKVKGVRAVKIDSVNDATQAKNHLNANILSFSANKQNNELTEYIDAFLQTKFSLEDRYIKRIEKISDYEKKK